MTEFLTRIPPDQLGIVVVLLIVIFKGMDVVKAMIISKLVGNTNGKVTPVVDLEQDLAHIQRTKDIYDYTKKVNEQIMHGDFSCQWKDREEVRDYIDVAKRQVLAMESVVSELQLLRKELVLTRNGSVRGEGHASI